MRKHTHNVRAVGVGDLEDGCRGLQSSQTLQTGHELEQLLLPRRILDAFEVDPHGAIGGGGTIFERDNVLEQQHANQRSLRIRCDCPDDVCTDGCVRENSLDDGGHGGGER